MSDVMMNPTDLQQQIARIDGLLSARVINDAIADGCAGTQFVSDAAREQATSLIRRHIRVNGETAVAAGGQSAAEFTRAELGKPEYAHFLKARTRTGGNFLGAHQPHVAPQQEAPEPRTLGAAMVQFAAAQAKAAQERQGAPGTFPAVGLKPIR
jgi:hypothetical protein